MVNHARLAAVAGALPPGVEDNAYLTEQFPEWSAEKIGSKTGIDRRHITGPDEYVSDLATAAARRLFEENSVEPEAIDYLLVCTQGSDFYLPVAATLVHAALELRPDCGANEFNLGCSGFVYGLGLAKGLIESGQASNILLITADTYSKYLNPADKSVRTIFGDGAAATLVTGGGSPESMHAFVYGTDGSGATQLIVPRGGLRSGADLLGGEVTLPEARGLTPTRWDLYMDGPAIFSFTLEVVPRCVEEVALKAGLTLDEIDLFVFHQANAFMLNHLARVAKVPKEKLFISMSEVGNTVSSTIPLALADALQTGAAAPGMKIMMLGFGVGLSWAGMVCTLAK